VFQQTAAARHPPQGCVDDRQKYLHSMGWKITITSNPAWNSRWIGRLLVAAHRSLAICRPEFQIWQPRVASLYLLRIGRVDVLGCVATDSAKIPHHLAKRGEAAPDFNLITLAQCSPNVCKVEHAILSLHSYEPF
jgi:hypothetical protein